MKINLERETAFHEAGHVFMFELVGWEYEDVEINGEEGIVNGDERTDTMLNKLICACIWGSRSKRTKNNFKTIESIES